jgi:hypothetical protein
MVRWLILAVLFGVSGCAHVPETPLPKPETESPAPAPVAPPVITTEPVLPLPAAPPASPEQEPITESVAQSPGSVAIVLSDRSPAYENVALELSHLLDDFVIYNLADRSLNPEAAFSNIADSTARVVIAIGLRAAEQAMARSTVPVVFCQVFNIEITDAAVPVKGVAAIPPLLLQVNAWKRLDPGLEDIGTILGEGHDDLIAEAEHATAEHGIVLHYRTAASDRETLYMFNRMAPDIDGFWLFPDNRVLSVPILKEILSYAGRHKVRVAVFNASLLDMGAAMSATAVEADIAATVVLIADRIVNGDADSIPAVSPLHEVNIRTAGAIPNGTAAKGSR